jgi:phosphatidylinositol 3,5-bisphosphate 5-phosphatase
VFVVLRLSVRLQYGGSEAHTAFFQRQRGDWEAATQSRDLMTSIRRFYSNTYTDSEKQDAINLFLGNFVPHANSPALWDLDSDYYLHYNNSGTDSRVHSW